MVVGLLFDVFSFNQKTSLRTQSTEKVHNTSKYHQKNTTTRTQSKHLGQETLIQSAESFLARNSRNSGPGPVVLGYGASNLGAVLYTRLDDVHGCVEDGTCCTTDSTGNHVSHDLLALVARFRFGELLADLEDAAEVTGVPENVAPERGLETVVHGENTFFLDDLSDDVNHAVILVCLGLVLETNLDELKRDDNEGLCGSGRGAGENCQGLGRLVNAEEVAVEGTPAVVGGELGGTLGSLHQDGSGDTTIQTRCSLEKI